MSPSSRRRGNMNLRTAGRAFWIGLAVSLAVHAFFLTKGRFPQALPIASPPLEARLEPESFDAVEPPAPEPASEPPTSARPAPQSQPASSTAQTQPASSAAQPLPDIPLLPPAPAPQPQPAPALSQAESPPPSAQPYALLTQAAERIRNLPARIEIVYELKGMLSGRQTHIWQRTGQHYTLDAVAEATGIASLFIGGQLIQKSSGRIGSLGLMPDRYEMRRPSGKKEILEFNHTDNLIESSRVDAKHGTRTHQLPLLPGAQDPLSSIYQLAMAARDGKGGLIVAASSKKVKGYPYRMLGAEILRTPLGELETLHVARAGDSSDTHLWLAPEKNSLPVRVSYVDEEGTEWILEAISIKMD